MQIFNALNERESDLEGSELQQAADELKAWSFPLSSFQHVAYKTSLIGFSRESRTEQASGQPTAAL